MTTVSDTGTGMSSDVTEHAAIDMPLTDVVLPGSISGRTIAEEFRKKFPLENVLYSTGYAQNAIVHQGRLDDGVELLARPYRLETLARTARRLLDG